MLRRVTSLVESGGLVPFANFVVSYNMSEALFAAGSAEGIARVPAVKP